MFRSRIFRGRPGSLARNIPTFNLVLNPTVPQHIEKLLYDRRSAAAALSISIRSLDYLLARGEFRTRRIGKKVLIPRAELTRFAAADHFDIRPQAETA